MARRVRNLRRSMRTRRQIKTKEIERKAPEPTGTGDESVTMVLDDDHGRIPLSVTIGNDKSPHALRSIQVGVATRCRLYKLKETSVVSNRGTIKVDGEASHHVSRIHRFPNSAKARPACGGLGGPADRQFDLMMSGNSPRMVWNTI